MSAVKRRLALYIPGYDPRPAAHYYRMYRTEAAKQAAVSGHEIKVGRASPAAEHSLGWTIEAVIEGERTETDYRLMWWDDIIRSNWARTPWQLLKTTISSSGSALFQGVLYRTYQWSWPAAMTCGMPYFLLWGVLIFSALLPVAGLFIGGALFGKIGFAGGLLLGLSLALGFLWIAFKMERKFNLAWLGRTIYFLNQDSKDREPRIEARRVEFAQLIADALASGDYDEVLLAGHSVGTTHAISVAARNIVAAEASATRFSLLTLGQTNSWLGFFKGANRFRGEIAQVAETEALDWVDFSAPPDAACFALVDPYTALGDTRTDRRNPKLLNAKFHEIMDPKAFARNARNWVELHFQYIRATVVPADYDYFAITAGPKTLWDRYAGRPSVRNFTRLRSRAKKHVR